MKWFHPVLFGCSQFLLCFLYTIADGYATAQSVSVLCWVIWDPVDRIDFFLYV